jgi:dimethylglycine catabolism A
MTQGSGDRLEQSTEAAVPFPHLYSPLELRGRVLRNRIVSTPHATGWGRDGLIDPREVDYHVRKAAGGCALVMTFGSASVEPTSAASYGSIALWDERNEPALRALADGVHARGALCMSQMTHMGRRGTSTLTGIPLRAPSDLPEGVHLEVPVPLAVSEIPAIVQRFADAAARLERCGWDGCEVTSFGGHLIEQFFDPRVNARTDEYGGSLENRTRFGREVLEAVRAAVSDDFLVGFRMALDQCLTGGLGPDELIEVGRSFAATGAIDLFSVSGGTGATRLSTAYFVPGDELPEGVFNERARRFREAVGQAGVREQLEHQAPVGRQGGQEDPELDDGQRVLFGRRRSARPVAFGHDDAHAGGRVVADHALFLGVTQERSKDRDMLADGGLRQQTPAARVALLDEPAHKGFDVAGLDFGKP